jgi:predicted amidophosphoribosyltransferase
MQCPGQDTRYWRPGDIYDVLCPYCEAKIEFFRDDTRLTCKQCGKKVRNPKLDVACAEWCEHAKECLGQLPIMEKKEDD